MMTMMTTRKKKNKRKAQTIFTCKTNNIVSCFQHFKSVLSSRNKIRCSYFTFGYYYFNIFSVEKKT